MKNKFIKWNKECKQVFRNLKELSTSAHILAYTDFGKPFKLHIDAC